MKKNIIILFLLFNCLVLPMQIMAQGIKSGSVASSSIAAQVVDSKGTPIKGVRVLGNESSVQTKSDNFGAFVINVKEGSFLVLEADGYEKMITTAATIADNFMKVVLKPAKDLRVDGYVQLPFQTMKKSRTTGNISVIDAAESLKTDTRMDVSAHLNSKITGNFGGFNFHGLGNAVIIVDGVVRDVNNLNMQEIEQITVLKDAYSRMLYGASGNTPVVLVTTKTGGKFKKVLNFNVESGVSTAISKPKFLDAASYMETYNKAAINDGLAPKFDTTTIASTRFGVDPIRFPNNNYWGTDYVKNSTNYTNLYAEASGGNDKVQYFLNLGWKTNSGWLAMPKDDQNNKLNLRGKVNFEVNNWLTMKADVVAIFDFYKGPESKTFYTDASKALPHLFPLLIPRDRVLNDSLLAGKKPIGNSLLGGTSTYQQNLYGDMVRGGSRMDMNRFLQYMVGFDIKLDKLTKGLKVSGLVDMDLYNYYSQLVNNNYAVYQMNDTINAAGKFKLKKIGEDLITNQQSVSDALSSFDRTWNGHVTANYDRTFGKHQITAVALGYYSLNATNGVVQDLKRLRFGAQANYTYDDKYTLEAGLVSENSNKMHPDNRSKATPSVGAAWIVSNENFMKSNKVIDYLKLRASYGVISNDSWTLGNYQGYFLYEPSFVRGGTFTYNNGSNTNTSVGIQTLGNKFDFQTRKEFVGGFDTYLFNKKLFIESSYWNSLSADNLVLMSRKSPATLGLASIGNFNASRYQGVELGVNYSENVGDFKINLGVNYLYSVSKIEKYEEPVYAANKQHLSRIGTSESSMWGLTSLGLYSAADFEADGKTLVTGIAKPSWGVVRPGDIKYLDYNKDGILNSDDQSVLGLNGNNQQVAFNIDLSYKNWQLFAVGSGSWGGNGMKNSNYYWFKGNDAKYSEEALKSFDPENPNPAAEYPRLSLSNGSNNYQGSTFWMFDRASFWLNTVQVAYNFDMSPKSALKTLKLFARGGNLLTVGKNTEITQLSWNSAPQSRVFSLGLVANF